MSAPRRIEHLYTFINRRADRDVEDAPSFFDPEARKVVSLIVTDPAEIVPLLDHVAEAEASFGQTFAFYVYRRTGAVTLPEVVRMAAPSFFPSTVERIWALIGEVDGREQMLTYEHPDYGSVPFMFVNTISIMSTRNHLYDTMLRNPAAELRIFSNRQPMERPA